VLAPPADCRRSLLLPSGDPAAACPGDRPLRRGESPAAAAPLPPSPPSAASPSCCAAAAAAAAAADALLLVGRRRGLPLAKGVLLSPPPSPDVAVLRGVHGVDPPSLLCVWLWVGLPGRRVAPCLSCSVRCCR
jgi:hypothetical protein